MMGSRIVTQQEAGGFTVSAVARRLGVAAATLRTWDRRYGMSPSLRTAGSHRRYTEDDLAVLQQMQGFMLSGMPPADAARAAQAGQVAGASPAPAPMAAPSPSEASGCAQPTAPDPDSQQKGLARAAQCLDTGAAAAIIHGSIQRWGVAWAWERVIAPVLRDVGERYEQSGQQTGIDVEHHLSHVVTREFIRAMDVTAPVNPRPVLLASAADEQHSLPLYALGAALAERGIQARVLGARTPDRALASAVRRTGPVAVFIWAQATSMTDISAAVPTVRPAAAVVVGGPGWRAFNLPETVRYPQTLPEAVATLSALVQPASG